MRITIAAPLAATLVVAGCGKAERASLPPAPSAEATAVGVKVVKPQPDAGAVLRATGELRARHEAVLSAEASGRILRFTVDVGSKVKKGDVLMELDASTPRIQVQQVEAIPKTTSGKSPQIKAYPFAPVVAPVPASSGD